MHRYLYVQICVCIHISLYTHVHIHICTCTNLYAHICRCAYSCMQICAQTPSTDARPVAPMPPWHTCFAWTVITHPPPRQKPGTTAVVWAKKLCLVTKAEVHGSDSRTLSMDGSSHALYPSLLSALSRQLYPTDMMLKKMESSGCFYVRGILSHHVPRKT